MNHVLWRSLSAHVRQPCQHLNTMKALSNLQLLSAPVIAWYVLTVGNSLWSSCLFIDHMGLQLLSFAPWNSYTLISSGFSSCSLLICWCHKGLFREEVVSGWVASLDSHQDIWVNPGEKLLKLNDHSVQAREKDFPLHIIYTAWISSCNTRWLHDNVIHPFLLSSLSCVSLLRSPTSHTVL